MARASFRAYLNESARIIEFTVDAVRNKQKVNLVNPQLLRVVG
jgi:hypothetical protein